MPRARDGPPADLTPDEKTLPELVDEFLARLDGPSDVIDEGGREHVAPLSQKLAERLAEEAEGEEKEGE